MATAAIATDSKMMVMPGESLKGDAPTKGGQNIRNQTNPPNFKKSTSKN